MISNCKVLVHILHTWVGWQKGSVSCRYASRSRQIPYPYFAAERLAGLYLKENRDHTRRSARVRQAAKNKNQPQMPSLQTRRVRLGIFCHFRPSHHRGDKAKMNLTWGGNHPICLICEFSGKDSSAATVTTHRCDHSNSLYLTK